MVTRKIIVFKIGDSPTPFNLVGFSYAIFLAVAKILWGISGFLSLEYFLKMQVISPIFLNLGIIFEIIFGVFLILWDTEKTNMKILSQISE